MATSPALLPTHAFSSKTISQHRRPHHGLPQKIFPSSQAHAPGQGRISGSLPLEDFPGVPAGPGPGTPPCDTKDEGFCKLCFFSAKRFCQESVPWLRAAYCWEHVFSCPLDTAATTDVIVKVLISVSTPPPTPLPYRDTISQESLGKTYTSSCNLQVGNIKGRVKTNDPWFCR